MKIKVPYKILSLLLCSQQTKALVGSLKLLVKEKKPDSGFKWLLLNEAINAKRNMPSPQDL